MARAEGARDGEAARNLSGPQDSGGVGDVRGIAPRARHAVEFPDRPMDSAETLHTTPLTAAHIALGGKMVAFGGYSMPVQYPLGILKEHLWTREHAGLFDVSHMGPSFLELAAPTGDPGADHRAVAALIEPLVCGDIRGLKPGQIRYTLLLNSAGGMVDDLMIGRPAEPENQGRLYIVVNAGTKDGDFAAIAAAAGSKARLEPRRRRRPAGVAGSGSRGGDGGTHPCRRGSELHDLHPRRVRRLRARHRAQRLHRRGRLRDPRPGRRGRQAVEPADLGPPRRSPSASAPAIPFGWRPVCRCTATTPTRRCRPSKPVSASRFPSGG